MMNVMIYYMLTTMPSATDASQGGKMFSLFVFRGLGRDAEIRLRRFFQPRIPRSQNGSKIMRGEFGRISSRRYEERGMQVANLVDDQQFQHGYALLQR